MKQWFSKLILMTSMLLLLFHNIVAHHHVEEPGHHHDHDALEHAQIDHSFTHFIHIDFTFHQIAAVLPSEQWLPEVERILLPETGWLTTEKPHPPARFINPNILRGPPSNC